jgi:hypothetical protein
MGRFHNGIIAVAACLVIASPAFAGHGNGNGHGHGRGHSKKHKRYASYCAPRQHVYYEPVYVQPAPVVYRACAPRYVVYRPQHVAVVRPAPYVHVGARIGAVDISAVFGGGGGWSNYDYGCNFCEAHYSSYGGWENHVQSCRYRPANTRIECRRWDRDGYAQWRDSRYDDRYDDRGYDDRRYDDERYDDRYYDEDDQG